MSGFGSPRVLIACETSGELRRRFNEAGCMAYSVDLLPADDGEEVWHLQCDALHAIYHPEDVGLDAWDLVIAHPPCTYLSASGLHWNKRIPGRAEKTEDALSFVRAIWDAPVRNVVIENPVGRIGTAIAPASQYIQPYEFGDDASKKTGLWIRGNIPLLRKHSDKRIPGRIVNGRERWANQTDSGQNRLGPSADRWKERSKTYPGIAQAMADQWAPILIRQTIGSRQCSRPY